ncbi:gliding motility-associated C-terminal domain-containing protein [Hymenobacter bucti]|uniref:Gliding motility-associated C-terminal domain-containing protein n=1 Tax=Hymenobacter bucti TaxID=1844114 RepID=A0ABW4QTP1_9BACT
MALTTTLLRTTTGAPAGRRWLLWVLLWLGTTPAWATHIVGGELDLQYLQGDTYQLSMNLYFDAINGNPGALDNSFTAGIFDKATNRLITSVTLDLVNNTFVSYTSPACAVGSLSTRQLVYRNRAPLLLPAATYGSAQGYYVAIERCCRNNAISNIVNPGAAAQAFYLEFPAVVRGGQPFRDSTPRIFPPLADYACVGELFYYDFAGQDADGDSLAYDMVTPLNGHTTSAQPTLLNLTNNVPLPGPYQPITWNAGLSASNQIPGAPTLTIGARTGRLTVRPTRVGLFVFGVRCQEYRRGVKIGETRRDFQLQVLVCPRNNAPSVTALPGTSGSVTYLPGRDTLRLVPGGSRCLRLRFTDPDASSQLTLSLRSVNYTGTLPTFSSTISGLVHSPGQPDTLVATLCFPDCVDTQGKVNFLEVIVADNGCALPKRDTVRIALLAIPNPNALPTLTTTAGTPLPLRVRLGQTLGFDLLATDPDGDPITYALSGTNGFAPAALGATLTAQAQAGTQRAARFNWPISCAAVTDPPGQVRELVFTATTVTPCGVRQAAPPITIPVIVDYSNAPPALTSTFPADSAGGPPLVRVALGQAYTASLTGTDGDKDVLVLSATGQDFNLADVGMRFTAPAGAPGQASGTFTWLPTCDGVSVTNGQARELVVTFQLQESTCRPQPRTRTVRFAVAQPVAKEFLPPNIITPNGDDKNQFFTLADLPPDFCDARFAGVKIFSRWGRQVYESGDRSFRWAGDGVGGTYYYLITYTTGRRYKGWVEVMP